MEVIDYLMERGGVGNIGAVARATSRNKLENVLKSGEVLRLNRSVVYLPNTDKRVLAARAHHGYVTCVSALAAYGVETWGARDSAIHLAVPRGCGGPYLNNLVLHRPSHLKQDRHLYAPPVEAVICALRCAQTHIERVVLVDSALNREVVHWPELVLAIADAHDRHLNPVLSDADARARSGMETFARLELKPLGLDVKVAYWIAGVGEVDFFIEGRLIVELDGFAYHQNYASFADDRRRSRVALQKGYATMRFTYDEAIRPGFIVSEVLHYLKNHPN